MLPKFQFLMVISQLTSSMRLLRISIQSMPQSFVSCKMVLDFVFFIPDLKLKVMLSVSSNSDMMQQQISLLSQRQIWLLRSKTHYNLFSIRVKMLKRVQTSLSKRKDILILSISHLIWDTTLLTKVSKDQEVVLVYSNQL